MNDIYLKINLWVRVPLSELTFTASRSSGPGGQHVNKTSSRITLQWSIKETRALSDFCKIRALKYLGGRVNKEGILQIHTEESSSQHRNKEIAKERFITLMQDALEIEKKRTPTKPSKSSKKRRFNEKKLRGNLKKLRRKPSED